MDQVKIGNYIAEKRKDLGMTQMQLAEKLGMSDKSVSKWERGVCLPDVSVYESLCKNLGISINEFLAGEDLKDNEIIVQSERNIISIMRDSKLRRVWMKRALAFLLCLVLILATSLMWLIYREGLLNRNYIKQYDEESEEYQNRTMLAEAEGISARLYDYSANDTFNIIYIKVYEYKHGKLVKEPEEQGFDLSIDKSNHGQKKGFIAQIEEDFPEEPLRFTRITSNGSETVYCYLDGMIKERDHYYSDFEQVDIKNIENKKEYVLGSLFFDYEDDLSDISATEFFQNHDKYSSKVGYGIVMTISFSEDMPEWAMGAQKGFDEEGGDTVVPDLTGMTAEEAMKELENSGLLLGNIYYIDSDEKETEYVVSTQDPSPKKKVSPGETVDIDVIKK